MREIAALLLVRAKLGASFTPPSCSGFFSDVTGANPFCPWIEALQTGGGTLGCGGGKFCPLDVLTRGELAEMVARTFDLDVWSLGL